MFDNIFAAIEKWMRELLTGMVESNMSTMFTDVNEKTSEIAAQVGRTPQNWNSSVFSMIQNLSESVVVPIAGIIITLVLCYELISMLTERNNLHDVDTWMFFKYFVKAWVAIYLVSNTFTITMAVFDVGQSVVNSASGIINGETAIDVSSLSMQMQAAMATMEIGELVVLALETFLVSFCMKIMSVVITVIVYGRMKYLVIAEKPSVARSISKVIGAYKHEDGYLEGGDCVVSWCLGHLAEYAAPEYYDERYKSWRFDDLPILPEEWKLLVSEDKKAHFNILRKLLRSKDFDYVVNACDAG